MDPILIETREGRFLDVWIADTHVGYVATIKDASSHRIIASFLDQFADKVLYRDSFVLMLDDNVKEEDIGSEEFRKVMDKNIRKFIGNAIRAVVFN